MEPEVDVHVDVAPQTEGLGEVEVPLVEQALEEQSSVEQTLSFCRLCYITFTSHSEQLPHEQQVCFAAFLKRYLVNCTFLGLRSTPLRKTGRCSILT